jgi:hypothetical protein
VYKRQGAWFSLVHKDGTEEKFQSAHWVSKLEDEKFKNRVFEIMDEEIIRKFDVREGNAEDFYDVDKDVNPGVEKYKKFKAVRDKKPGK